MYVIAYIDNYPLPIVPDIVNVIKAEILDDDLSRNLLISWSPFTYVTTVSIMYNGTCSNNIDSVCINESKITATHPDNLTVNNLVPGIEYKLLIWGENALGRGHYQPLAINLTKTGKQAVQYKCINNNYLFFSSNIQCSIGIHHG